MRTIVIWVSATIALVTLLIGYQSSMPAGDPHAGGRAQCTPVQSAGEASPPGATATAPIPSCDPDDPQGKPGERR